MKKSIIVIAVILFLSVALASIRYQIEHSEGSIVIKTDTVTIVTHDTIFREMPVPVTREIVRYEEIYITDTVVKNDTVFMVLPIEQVIYSDSCYMAWISGYHPSLDSIRIFREETVRNITTTIYHNKRNRWGLGIHAGYGASCSGISPYIGIGISYNLYSW